MKENSIEEALKKLSTGKKIKMYGVLKLKGITVLTKQEVVSKKTIEEQIKKLENDGYWDFLEERDLEKTISILKSLLEEK